MAGSSTKIFLCLVLLAVLVLSALPAIAAYGCMPDCIGRCSNGQNLAECTKMCTEACVPIGGGLTDKILN